MSEPRPRLLAAALLAASCAGPGERDAAKALDPGSGTAEEVAPIRAGAVEVGPGFVVVDSAAADVTGDGSVERVELVVQADTLPGGRVLWEDGHRWLLLVRGEAGGFALMDAFVPWGTVRLWVVDDYEGGVHIVVQTESSTGGVSVEEYSFEPEEAGFIRTRELRVPGRLLHRTPSEAFR